MIFLRHRDSNGVFAVIIYMVCIAYTKQRRAVQSFRQSKISQILIMRMRIHLKPKKPNFFLIMRMMKIFRGHHGLLEPAACSVSHVQIYILFFRSFAISFYVPFVIYISVWECSETISLSYSLSLFIHLYISLFRSLSYTLCACHLLL